MTESGTPEVTTLRVPRTAASYAMPERRARRSLRIGSGDGFGCWMRTRGSIRFSMMLRRPSPSDWGVGLLAISSAFPILGSLVVADAMPRTIGFLDVAVAAITTVTLLRMHYRFRALVTAPHRARAYEQIQRGSVVLLALLAAYFLAGKAMRWEIVVPGLAWRAWLAIYALPSLIAASATGGRPEVPSDAPP